MSDSEPRSIHYTELPPAVPGSPLTTEWEFYRREVGLLLSEGRAGKWVLIKGEQVLGLFDSRWDAREEGLRRFLRQPFLVHQVQERERLLRTRLSH